MKQTAAGIFLTFLLSVCTFAGELDFTLVNQTGFAISKVFVSPTTTEEWGDDVMGADALLNDTSVDIKFSPKEDEKIWDLKATDKDGNEVFWTGIDLTQFRTITLHFENQQPTATFE